MRNRAWVAAVVPAAVVAALLTARTAPHAQPRHPEPPAELLAMNDAHYAKSGSVQPCAYRAGLEQRHALEVLRPKVAGAGGSWAPYGRGNLRVPGGGYDNIAARVDSFFYDDANQRLFAAVGTGGIWMSQAIDGKPATLGDLWVSVGETLPSQITGAVAWTPAGGTSAAAGTLIAVGGEAVMGSGGYLGLGGFWSDDVGANWHQASGIPDAALAFHAAVDPAHPAVIYAATSKGLFRSADAGRSYANVRLPTTDDCKGVETLGPCQFTNYVTDVVVQQPGGTGNVTCGAAGCPVLAAVGFRVGSGLAFTDGRSMAPANGIYRSATGEVDTFTKLAVSAPASSPNGFAPQDRIGRVELGAASGAAQDHGYVYAIVEDAVLFNHGFPYIDAPVDFPTEPSPLGTNSSVFNGLYVSADFGSSWIRMADTAEIADNPASNSDLVLDSALGYAPGVQSWYNEWVKPDPTHTDPLLGVPTRMTFGLEEVWQSITDNVPLNGAAQQGPSDFQVIGAYGGQTHPDQHDGIYIPTGDGGVCLFASNDGGIFRQCVAAGEAMDNTKWTSANTGIYALLPYGVALAKDGTAWWGLQDNGSGSTSATTGKSTMWFGADGFFSAVDPDNAKVAYTESQNAGMLVTTDGGQSSTGITPTGMSNVGFDNYFTMDPADAAHLITGGQQIFETTRGPTVRPGTWTQVFLLGTDAASGASRRQTALALSGASAYAGFCGPCGVSGNDTGTFANGIATNVGGDKPPVKASADGWHLASAAGLDNRYITSLEIDPADVRTIYVTLAGYLSGLRPPGSYLDLNARIGTGNVFKSTDGGEHFHDISGALPRVQANSVILRGSQLLVGTDVGAFISGDTEGTTWAVLGIGLPNVPVNMLRLRPGMDTQLVAATFGRHLWVYNFDASASQPQGHDQYHIVSALPPSLLLVLGVLAGLRRRHQ